MSDAIAPVTPLAWGARVSREFRDAVRNIATLLRIEPDWLMAVMAFESGLRADARNKMGSGATGLIQFMPQTAALLGTTTDELAAMHPVQQLAFVFRYLLAYQGRIHSFEDLYMAILWPAAIGKPNSYAIFDRNDPKYPKRYIQNAGLDWNHDGKITKAEAAAGPARKLVEGLLAENRA